VLNLQLAEAWHIPPWEIEEADDFWINRAVAYYRDRPKE